MGSRRTGATPSPIAPPRIQYGPRSGEILHPDVMSAEDEESAAARGDVGLRGRRIPASRARAASDRASVKAGWRRRRSRSRRAAARASRPTVPRDGRPATTPTCTRLRGRSARRSARELHEGMRRRSPTAAVDLARGGGSPFVSASKKWGRSGRSLGLRRNFGRLYSVQLRAVGDPAFTGTRMDAPRRMMDRPSGASRRSIAGAMTQRLAAVVGEYEEGLPSRVPGIRASHVRGFGVRRRPRIRRAGSPGRSRRRRPALRRDGRGRGCQASVGRSLRWTCSRVAAAGVTTPPPCVPRSFLGCQPHRSRGWPRCRQRAGVASLMRVGAGRSGFFAAKERLVRGCSARGAITGFDAALRRRRWITRACAAAQACEASPLRSVAGVISAFGVASSE